VAWDKTLSENYAEGDTLRDGLTCAEEATMNSSRTGLISMLYSLLPTCAAPQVQANARHLPLSASMRGAPSS
jgi:hypothetical protein